MADDSLFLTGIAQHLHDQGLGVWAPARAYTAAETAIALEDLPTSPDAAIALAAYGVSDPASGAASTVGLQVRSRAAGADSTGSRDLAGRIFRDLHGRTRLTLPGGVFVLQIYRTSWTSGGQDGNRRWSMIQNFYADLHVPDLHI